MILSGSSGGIIWIKEEQMEQVLISRHEAAKALNISVKEDSNA